MASGGRGRRRGCRCFLQLGPQRPLPGGPQSPRAASLGPLSGSPSPPLGGHLPHTPGPEGASSPSSQIHPGPVPFSSSDVCKTPPGASPLSPLLHSLQVPPLGHLRTPWAPGSPGSACCLWTVLPEGPLWMDQLPSNSLQEPQHCLRACSPGSAPLPTRAHVCRLVLPRPLSSPQVQPPLPAGALPRAHGHRAPLNCTISAPWLTGRGHAPATGGLRCP